MEEKLIFLNFVVEEKIFENEEKSFAVFYGSSKGRTFVAVGPLISVDEGETLKLAGYYKNSKTYGRQFRVLRFKRELPNTKAAIVKFLAAGKIRGLKEAIAKKIVDYFGVSSLDVLENSPEKLCEIKGIGPSLVEKIKEDFKNFLSLKQLNIFLQQFNISAGVCLKIWERWGIFSLSKIKNNPYCLCLQDFGVCFKTMDEIAFKLNIKKDDENRISAAIEFVLNHNAVENGHSCVPKQSLLKVVAEFVGLEETKVEKVLKKELERLNLFSFEVEKTKKEFIFLKKYYIAESFIAKRVVELSNFKDELDEKDYENLIAIEEDRLKIKFSSSQKEAIKKAISNGVFILTGGPGTGKTTILNAVISILEQSGLKLAICAPTGKAAKRLEEITKRPATTIHRLLKVQQMSETKREFVHSEKNLLKSDAIVVDEMSMVDCMLFFSLLKALKEGCRLILSGDFNQLPCILTGHILKNMLDSNVVSFVYLKEIFRQSKKSYIVLNAHNIINEKPLILNKKGKDFFFIKRNSPTAIVNCIFKIVQKKLPEEFGFFLGKDIQIISPLKKGIIGTIELNKKLQQIANPKSKEKQEFSFGLYRFREGDKILQVRNNYDVCWEKDGEKGEGIFNGEIGTILKIDNKQKRFVVDFEGKIADLEFSMAKDVELGLAITVHKSQGSEFPVIVMPIGGGGEFFSRNLLYTAITRAKKLIVLVGDEISLQKMCKQKKVNYRYSMLKEFLKLEKEAAYQT